MRFLLDSDSRHWLTMYRERIHFDVLYIESIVSIYARSVAHGISNQIILYYSFVDFFRGRHVAFSDEGCSATPSARQGENLFDLFVYLRLTAFSVLFPVSSFTI